MDTELRVAIVPFKKLPAAGARLEVMPLADALDRSWDTDAAFVTYYTPDEDDWPRLKKPHLKQVRQAGGKILISCLVLDYDRKTPAGGKARWANEDEAYAWMGELPEGLPWPTYYYTTKHGLRLIYELATHLSPEDSEKAYDGLLALFTEAGIEMDRSTRDWTRLFFLPWIFKDGKALHDLGYIFVSDPGPKLDGKSLLTSAGVVPAQPVTLDGARLGSASADGLLLSGGTQTSFYKQAKSLLGKGPDAPWLFEHQPVPYGEGERNNGIWALVGRAMSRLWGVEGLTPEQVYALLRPGVAQLSVIDVDPCAVLWEMIQRTWETKHEQIEIKRVTFEEALAAVVNGFRDQCRACDISLEGLANKVGMSEVDYVRQHLIVNAGQGGVFLMQADGTYLPTRLRLSGIHNRIASMGLAQVYDIHDIEGNLRSDRDLMALRGISVSHVIGQLGLESSELRDIGRPTMHLAVPTAYLRSDLPGQFVPEVDQFLRLFAGANYDRLEDWLGHALDIRQPICALSLAGDPGVGKSLMGEILGACFGPADKNSHEVLTTSFNGGLQNNPVIHIDEGLPGTRHVDELLRTYVSGGTLPITKKGLDTVQCEVYPRVIFTANNLEALRTAIGSRDLDDASHQALTTRILHLEAQGHAAEWFEANQGRAMTSNWIVGECLAVRHFLWLHKQRTRPSKWCGSGRFLVEGERESVQLEEFRYQTVAAQIVIGGLVSLMQAVHRGGAQIVVKEDGVLWTTSSGVHAHLDDSRLTVNAVGAVLRKIGEEKRGGPASNSPRGRSFKLKIEVLVRYALEHGIKCPELFEMIDSSLLERIQRKANG